MSISPSHPFSRLRRVDVLLLEEELLIGFEVAEVADVDLLGELCWDCSVLLAPADSPVVGSDSDASVSGVDSEAEVDFPVVEERTDETSPPCPPQAVRKRKLKHRSPNTRYFIKVYFIYKTILSVDPGIH